MSTLPNVFTPNITKLDGANYEGWRKAIMGILSSIGLWLHVTGTADVNDYASIADYQAAALRCYSILINTIDYSQYGLVQENDTARTLWKRLEAYFRPRGFGTRIVMRRRFFKMRMMPDEPMVKWIARVDETVGRLRGIGAVVPDDDIMVVLIEGAPKDYDSMITALDTVPDNMLTVAFVKGRLINEYARLTGSEEDDDEPAREEAKAMAAYRGGSSSARGGAPGRRQPARRPAAGPSQRNLTSTECHRCGRTGHLAAECRLILEGDQYMSDDASGHATAALDIEPDLALVTTARNGDDESFSFM